MGRRLKNLLLYLLARLLIGALGLLPTRLCLGAGRCLGRLGCRLARPERSRAERNLEAALPDLDPGARRRLVREMFAHLGESAAECIKLDRLRDLVRFEPGSIEALLAARARGHGVLFVTAHLGNWELMAAALSRHVPAVVLYKPSYDPRFTRLLCRFREANGVRGLDVSGAGHLLEVTRALRGGAAVGVLIDQPTAAGVAGSFLGRAALTSKLVPVLARRTGAAVVAGWDRRTGTCQHLVSIVPLEDATGWRDLEASVQTLNAPLEAAIRGAPEQWAWSLDRWRGIPAAAPEGKSSPNVKT